MCYQYSLTFAGEYSERTKIAAFQGGFLVGEWMGRVRNSLCNCFDSSRSADNHFHQFRKMVDIASDYCKRIAENIPLLRYKIGY